MTNLLTFALLGTVKQILIHDGLRGMYRGLGPTMLGYLPTWAIYFTVYDGIKTYLGRSPLDGPANPSGTSSLQILVSSMVDQLTFSGECKGLLVSPYFGVNDRGCHRNYMHQSPLGHKDSVHGAPVVTC